MNWDFVGAIGRPQSGENGAESARRLPGQKAGQKRAKSGTTAKNLQTKLAHRRPYSLTVPPYTVQRRLRYLPCPALSSTRAMPSKVLQSEYVRAYGKLAAQEH
jgi:hypothetical protein